MVSASQWTSRHHSVLLVLKCLAVCFINVTVAGSALVNSINVASSVYFINVAVAGSVCYQCQSGLQCAEVLVIDCS